MIPQHFRTLFWDTNIVAFDPAAYPSYTIFRVLEHGDEDAVAWLFHTFSKEQVRDTLRAERRLSPRSASFWALVLELPELRDA